MKLSIAIIGLLPYFALAENSLLQDKPRIENGLLAQTEVQSTAGIANRAQRHDEQLDENEPPLEESQPYFEEAPVEEALPPPVTEERISPTRQQSHYPNNLPADE